MKNDISIKPTVAFISAFLLSTSAFTSATGGHTRHLSFVSLADTLAAFNEKVKDKDRGFFLEKAIACPEITKTHTDALKTEGATIINGETYSVVGTDKDFKKNVPDARNVITSNIMNENTRLTLSEADNGAIGKTCTYTWKSLAGVALGGTYTFTISADTGVVATEIHIDNQNSYDADFLVAPDFNDGTKTDKYTKVLAQTKSYLTFLSTPGEDQKLAVQYEGGVGLKKCSENIPAGSKQKATFSSTAMIATCKAK